MRLLYFVAAALTLFAVGCKDNNDPTNKEVTKGNSSKITFRISFPQGEVFTYRNAIHDKLEWSVKKLTMYTFSNDGSKLLAIDPIAISQLIPSGDAEYAYTKEFDKSQAGVYRFLFIANDEVAGAQVGTTSQADFEKLLMSKQIADNSTSKDLLTGDATTPTIPMTGVAKQGGSTQIAVTGTTSPITVLLTRVVARIDVSNHIPNLTITKLSIKNTYDRTTAFPTTDADGNRTYEAPATATKINLSAGYAQLPNPFKGVAGEQGAELKKAFYLYEGPQPADEAQKNEATTIVIEGNLENGQQVVLEVPFVTSSSSYIPLDVHRNALYKVVVGDNKPLEKDSKVVFTIEDTPWNSVILNHDMQIIKVVCWEIEKPTCHYDALNRTFYTSIADERKFELQTRLAGHHEFVVKMIHSDSGKEYQIEKRKIQDTDCHYITFPSPLTVEKDKAVFEISSDAAPSIKRYLTIIYDKNYNNPDAN